MRIGLVSDTHGLLRPEALVFLVGSDAIVHAGDIGDDPALLESLRRIAPLTVVVRGNNDVAPWARDLPETALLPVGEARLMVVHDLQTLDLRRLPRGVRAVVCGHSHRPRVEERDGVLIVNPGSAGPRRFGLPIGVGEIVVEGDAWRARTVVIEVSLLPRPAASRASKTADSR